MSSRWTRERNRELKHLKQADRSIAALNAQIGRQRTIIQAAEAKGRPSQEAASLIETLETSRRALEKHREFILELLANGGLHPDANGPPYIALTYSQDSQSRLS
jgi:hypothetical protein